MMPTFVLHKNNYTQPIADYKQIRDSRKIDFNCNSIPNIRVNVVNLTLPKLYIVKLTLKAHKLSLLMVLGALMTMH